MLPYVTASQAEKISREVVKESGSAPFIVTGTPSMEDETPVVICDKTYGEVAEAFISGKTILLHVLADEEADVAEEYESICYVEMSPDEEITIQTWNFTSGNGAPEDVVIFAK